MTVKRYDPIHMQHGEPNQPCRGMGLRWKGQFVEHSDYAALEARCAELERERDELKDKMKLSELFRCGFRAINAKNEAINTTDISLSERDALQDKLAAAVEALRNLLRVHALDNDGAGSFDPSILALEKIAESALAILAGHASAPATEQQAAPARPNTKTENSSGANHGTAQSFL